jgi:hypothetical protein
MMLLKNSLMKIAIGVALMLGGWKLAELGDSRISMEDLQAKGELCKNAASTLGSVRDSVMETTIKIAGARVKMYEYKYDYLVGEEVYLAKYVTNREKPEAYKQIWFDKRTPTVYATTEPCTDFENYKKTKTVGSKAPFYIFGVLGMFMGLGLSWGTIKSTIVTLVRGEKK